MNSVRIGLIIICAAAAASAWLSLRAPETVAPSTPQTTRALTSPFAASDASADAEREARSTAVEGASEVRALESGSDTTGVLAPTMTLDELLDALDADIGEEGAPIDREAVGASLRSDPALIRTLRPAL